MNQQTIDRLKQTMAQNTKMNTDLTELLTLAEQGWQIDTDLIASEIQAGRDAVANELAGKDIEITNLTTEKATLESNVVLKNTEIETLQAEKAELQRQVDELKPVVPVEEIV